jgi:hypothetical protein
MERKRLEYERRYNQLLNEERLEKRRKTEINKELLTQIQNNEKEIYKRLKEKNEKYIKIQKEAFKNKVQQEKSIKNKEKQHEKQRQEKEEEEKKEKLRKEENLKRKQYYKPISSMEIREFGKKFDEELERRLYEKKKRRLIQIEKIVESNLVLMKKETIFKKRVMEEEKENRNKQEKDKLERVFKLMKAQNFSKIVYEKLGKGGRRSDENRISKGIEVREGKERKDGKGNRVIKAGKVRKKMLLFSKKYRNVRYNKKNVQVKQGEVLEDNKEYDKTYKEVINSKSKENNTVISKVNEINHQGYKPVIILKPKDKLPNYLIEMSQIRKSKSKKSEGTNWKQIINNNKYNKYYNIESVKHQTDFIEEQIKQKEKYLRLVGGIDKAPEDAAKLMSYKIESIKAKLAVLDAIEN